MEDLLRTEEINCVVDETFINLQQNSSLEILDISLGSGGSGRIPHCLKACLPSCRVLRWTVTPL